MINEQFLNLSLYVLIKENNLFKDLPKLVNEIFQNIPSDNNTFLSQKIDLVKYILRQRLKNIPISLILDNIQSSPKFKDYQNIINQILELNYDQEKEQNIVNHIIRKHKLTKVLNGYPELDKFKEDLENDKFEDSEEIIKSYEKIINRLYKDLNETKRQEKNQQNESLNLLYDNYDNVVTEIKNCYSPENLLSTGYEFLDNALLGGFQPKRIYIFAGSSGDGKSTLMINFMNNFIHKKHEDTNILNVIFYFTFENQIDETFLRLYCCYTKKDASDVIKRILYEPEKTKKEMEQELKEIMLQNNILIIFDYFRPKTILVSDIIDRIDDHKNQLNKPINIVAIIIDYLDQMNIDNNHNYDNYRFVLGHITTDLKILSITMKTPVLSVTQVNRSGYDKKHKKEVTMIAESIQKVENADFIGLVTFIPLDQQEQIEEDNQDVHKLVNTYDDEKEGVGTFIIDIEKNRSGPKHKRIYLNADFKKFLITNKNSLSKSSLSFEIKDNEEEKNFRDDTNLTEKLEDIEINLTENGLL